MFTVSSLEHPGHWNCSSGWGQSKFTEVGIGKLDI